MMRFAIAAALLSQSYGFRAPQLRAPRLGLLRSAAAPAAPAPPPALTGGKVQKRLIGLLSFNAGVADVVLFKKHGCYATMMTGNLIKGACAAVDGRLGDASFFLAMMGSYLGGCAAHRALDQRCEPRTKGRAVAAAVAVLFAASDRAGLAKRTGALWLAAGFGLVNSISVEVLLTITWMLTIHMQKLTNFAADALGLSGRDARGAAKFGPVLRRSVVVLSTFAGGVAVGHAFCDDMLRRGFATVFGAWYAVLILAHERGTLGLDALGRSLLLNKNANPGLRED